MAKHFPQLTWNDLAIRDGIFATKSIVVARMCPMYHFVVAFGLISSAIMVAAAEVLNYYLVVLNGEQIY